jgi:hypothetical protein
MNIRAGTKRKDIKNDLDIDNIFDVIKQMDKMHDDAKRVQNQEVTGIVELGFKMLFAAYQIALKETRKRPLRKIH